MPRAVVLNSASKSSLTGGTFADVLVANAGDSLAVANFNTGNAKMLEAWGIDSASVAEGQLVYTRPQATHDQQHGLRFEIPSLTPGGAGNVGAHNILPGAVTIDLYKSDTLTVSISGTAADAVLVSWVTLYDDLPGVQGVFGSWDQIQALQLSAVGIQVTAVASATKGAYGAQRAFNADDDRLHANTWYAILGASVQTQVCTISLLGPDWGGQRIGMPSGALDLRSNTWFVDQTIKWGLPLIPCFNSNNKGNVLVQLADGSANTSPKIDFFLYELTGPPGF
jgi:hypothetical protein